MIMNLITDPAKQVITDAVVRRVLERMQVDPDSGDAIFKYDYSADRPVSKMYHIEKGARKGQHVVAISNLPMRRPDNQPVEPGFELSGGIYRPKANLFTGEISGAGIQLWPLNSSEYAAWEPVLYLNGVRRDPTGAWTHLEIDPVNSNYRYNVLEMNYGICTRRLRIIEGRFFERWIFTENPKGDVRIVHNKVGTVRLLLGGKFIQVEKGDEEFVPATVFDEAKYPFIINATATLYTGASDGSVEYFNTAGATWAELKALSAGSGTSLTGTGATNGNFRCDANTDKFDILEHKFYPFDNSSVSSIYTVLSGTVSFYGYSSNVDDWGSSEVCLVKGTPANPASLVVGDFDQLTLTELATRKAISSWSNAGYNDYTLNAAGVAHIQSNLGGYCTFVTPNGYWVDNSAPAWAVSYDCYAPSYFSEQGAGYKPKEVFVYELSGPSAVAGTIDGADIGMMGGITGADIGKIGGI